MPIARNPSIATALIQDRKAANANGGTFTAGAWRTRDLNTITHSSISGVSIASNQFVLPVGTYIIFSEIPAYSSGRHQARLFNASTNSVAVDASGTEIYSSKSYTQPDTQNDVIILARLQITIQTTFRIEHYCQATSEYGNGFGVGNAFTTSPSIFTQVLILKI